MATAPRSDKEAWQAVSVPGKDIPLRQKGKGYSHVYRQKFGSGKEITCTQTTHTAGHNYSLYYSYAQILEPPA